MFHGPLRFRTRAEPDPYIVRGDRTGLPAGRTESVQLFRLGVAACCNHRELRSGALNPDIHISEAVASLGLILFVYTLGSSRGRRSSHRSARKVRATRCWR